MNHAETETLSPYSLYVIILNWNSPEDTIACVDSVAASTACAPEIVVVDNGSTDDSLERFARCLRDTVEILQSKENLGFAGGVNLGVERALAAGAQSILILNNDTIIDEAMIRHLIRTAADHPGAGIVGPVIRHYDYPERVWRIGDREHRFLPMPLKVPESALPKAGGEPFPVDYVTGCGMLVRSRVFETIGLFDTNHFMYFEDADFCRCARQAGFEVWCAPKAHMWHKVSSSASRQKPAMRYAEAWGRAQFYRKHPHSCAPILTLLYLVAHTAKSTLQAFLSQDWNLIRPELMGLVDGYRNRPSRMSEFLR